MNTKIWLKEYLDAPTKKAIPILSFPGAGLIGHTVDELVKDGHLQALCMEAIAQRYDMGAALSLMDLSVEAEAFGAEVRYSSEEVPTVYGSLVKTQEDAQALSVPKVGTGRTGECIKGIQEAKFLIKDRPVLAGMIGPYSLAGRLLDMTEIMILCYEEPEMVETVLEKATRFLIDYAKAFKTAGADGIMLAEPAAGLLSPNLIEEFSTPYVQKIRQAVEDDNFLFVYHNCGNVTPIMEKIKEINAAVYSMGNAINLEDALKVLPTDSLIIGNIDPAGILRNGTPEVIQNETKSLMKRCCKYPNFVIASGCDIPPATPMENLDAFFRAVDEFYAEQ